MESLELKIFREVAAEGSISRAAENLNYVQSNVTAHIKRLEDELETTLFIRHGKGVTLTEDGNKLLYYANTVLETLDKAVAAFRVDQLTLRIGATQTLAAARLPAWLSAYRNAYPDIAVSVETDDQNALLSALEKSKIDCAFIQSTYLTARTKTLFTFSEDLRIAAPLHCIESDIRKMPIVVNRMDTCPYRKRLTDWSFLQNSCMPMIIELDTLEAIINSVALGIGISLLPLSTFATRSDITSFQIYGIKPMRLHMVTRRNQQSNQVYHFMDIAKSSLAAQAPHV